MNVPDWLNKPTLAGSLVLLRPFTAEDTGVMREVLQDFEVRKLTGSIHRADAPEQEDHERLRSWYATRATVDERLDLAVVDRATGVVVGEVVFNEWSVENNSGNFRILLGPEGRGRGLGTEATRLFLEHGFGVLGLHRVSLDVFSFNPRAQRVYQKVGFVVEGVAREAFRWDGQWIDEIWMSILDHEWDRHHGFP